MSTTVTQTIQRVTREQQYLTQDFEESRRLEEEAKKIPFHTQIVWRNVALFVALHIGALIGAYQLMFEAKWLTVLWTFMGWVISGLGITAGAHRLWSHRSYKARLPARIILMCFNSMAFQNDIIEWSRDHRCHHKWTDTTADPHDTRRGFFFSHMGWLLCRKHPQVKDNGQKLDLSDLFADPVCAFQRRYYLPLVALFCFLLPTVVAVYGWGETPFIAFYTTALFRYCWTLHMTWLINSAAHYIGYRPYDAAISSVENIFTTIFAIGEGGHNYHHTFPQDYRTSEYSLKFNWTKLCIDTFASLGWVYDRKVVAEEAIARQMEKFGDHSGYKHP